MTFATVATHQSTNDYVFANDYCADSQRLQLLAAIYDPVTRACLERIDVAEGWSCWEVGAGYGTIAHWLAERVGLTGKVLATDLDTRFLVPLQSPTLQVVRHDVVRDALPPQRFDLIHARLLLCHLQEREQVMDRMIEALKPGGWLVIEDYDSVSLLPDPGIDPPESSLEAARAVRELLRRRGVDLRFGRRVVGLLRARGLQQVSAEGRVFMSLDGSAYARLQRLGLEQVHDELLKLRLITPEDYERDLAALEHNYAAPLALLWSAAGRKAL
jgi:SAM-dependent methyltransferase